MELIFMTLMVMLPLIALDALVWRYGVDSRLTVDDDKGRQTAQRWI